VSAKVTPGTTSKIELMPSQDELSQWDTKVAFRAEPMKYTKIMRKEEPTR
jgi:hypothetical protein